MVLVFIAVTILFVILVALLYYGYSVLNDKDPFSFFKKSKNIPDKTALEYWIRRILTIFYWIRGILTTLTAIYWIRGILI